MGLADRVTKKYLSDKDIFAAAFNYFLYNGEMVIQPEQLQEVDTTLLTTIYDKANVKSVSIEKYRDILKRVIIHKSDEMTYMLFGIEAQSHVHHAMPVRNMLYDVLQYAGQVEDLTKHLSSLQPI